MKGRKGTTLFIIFNRELGDTVLYWQEIILKGWANGHTMLRELQAIDQKLSVAEFIEPDTQNILSENPGDPSPHKAAEKFQFGFPLRTTAI